MSASERRSDAIGFMAAGHPQDTAWLNLADQSELTFGCWDRQANQLARGLSERGIGCGDRVVIAITPDEPFEWLISYVAIHRAGAVAVPVNTRLSGPELAGILAHAEPAGVLASAASESGTPWAELMAVIKGLQVAAVTGSATGVTAFAELLHPDGSEVFSPVGSGAKDVMYTSGTTGGPKGCRRPVRDG